ncbi:MAG: hypothetical protein ABL970_00565 [Nitrospira sp.]
MNPMAVFAPVIWIARPRVLMTLLVFGLSAYLLIAFNWSYSDGNRAGYIQKFSQKGWICKTYEGELAMTTVPGVAPVLWSFSVWDKPVADDLAKVMGKRVILHYKERRYLPTTCFGETDYFVDRVEIQE